jgi:hypothetical protein
LCDTQQQFCYYFPPVMMQYWSWLSCCVFTVPAIHRSAPATANFPTFPGHAPPSRTPEARQAHNLDSSGVSVGAVASGGGIIGGMAARIAEGTSSLTDEAGATLLTPRPAPQGGKPEQEWKEVMLSRLVALGVRKKGHTVRGRKRPSLGRGWVQVDLLLHLRACAAFCKTRGVHQPCLRC